MSVLLKQTACPECRKHGKDKSGDNLSIYSDGHEWCYGCGYYKSANGITKFLSEQEYKKEMHEVFLPADCDVSYPDKALQWVKQYELDRNDLLRYNTMWSESRQRLIFPIYDGDGNLLAYQGRYFGEDKEVKWWGWGDLKNTFNILGRSSNTLVLTEDIISAIKVSRFVQAMPLYGSSVGFYRFKRLYKLYGYGFDVRLWLDKDKQHASVVEARRGQMCGLNCSVIITDEDPKELSYGEIKALVNSG